MKLHVIAVLLTIAVSAYADNNGKKNCNCIALRSCEEIDTSLRILHQRSRRRHQKYTEYVKTLSCGYVDDIPLICCPSTDKNVPNGTKNEENSKIPDVPPQHSESPKKSDTKNYYAECGRDLNRGHHFGQLTELSDFPWLALLEYDTPNGKELLCGGVLISDQYILTAAHCVTSRANNLTSVRLGEYDVTTSLDCVLDGNPENTQTCADPLIKINVDQKIIHEGYQDGITHREDQYVTSDLALLKLKEKVTFTPYVQPICLPTKKSKKKRKFLVAGWGKSFIPNTKGSDQKLVSKLTGIDANTCTSNYGQQLPFVGKQHICAVGNKKKREQPCIGDAGGPLMAYEAKNDGTIRMTVFGVSYMDLQCNKSDDLPGVYTHVHAHMPWIRQHIEQQ